MESVSTSFSTRLISPTSLSPLVVITTSFAAYATPTLLMNAASQTIAVNRPFAICPPRVPARIEIRFAPLVGPMRSHEHRDRVHAVGTPSTDVSTGAALQCPPDPRHVIEAPDGRHVPDLEDRRGDGGLQEAEERAEAG